MDKALDIAKFIVNKNEGMTNLEMQKILYYLWLKARTPVTLVMG